MTETITFPNGHYSYHQTFTEIVRFINNYEVNNYEYKMIAKVAMDFETKNMGRMVWMGNWQTELHDFVSSSDLVVPTVTVNVTIKSKLLNSDDKRTFPATESGYNDLNQYLRNVRRLYTTAVGRDISLKMGTGIIDQQKDKTGSLLITIL
jgi:hypothetical protein